MCLYPKLIRNRKYKPNKKNGGNVPPILDERVKWVPIGCGNCMECRKQKAREWQIRLQEDIKHNKNGKFITLTFSNESIKKLCTEREELKNLKGYELDNGLATIAVRLFLERWRKKYKKSLRHWLVTELGHNGTENIHLHGIVWATDLDELEEIWQYGYIWKGKGDRKQNWVSEQTVNYITKYILKVDEKHKTYKSKVLTSPGIGSGYTTRMDSKGNKFDGTRTEECYRTSRGYKVSMPIYWRNKIYSEQEREKLWLQRLDKGERWVCGEKVKADDTKTYYKLLEWYREKNTKLGYGSDEKNWEQEVYERERRILLMQTRIQNAKQKK